MPHGTDSITETPHLIQQACLLEVLAPKPGNVHPAASFDDCDARDFVRSAMVCAQPLADSRYTGVGPAVLSAIHEVRRVTHANTNLGIVLLIAPLAAVPRNLRLVDGISRVLATTNVADADAVYEAIRLSSPGGLGESADGDVHDAPPGTLTECMALAADRDLIAAQYANDFAVVLGDGQTFLSQAQQIGRDPLEAIVVLALLLLAEFPDSLIARKCGAAIADDASARAAHVLDSGTPDSTEWSKRFRAFDGWLRADGNQRNPGTTADLIAAILFAAMRDHEYDPGVAVVSPDGDVRFQSR